MLSAEAIQALGALAHEHRLAIYRLLVERGPQGMAAGIIAEQLGIAPSSLTFHLQHLQRAGLIEQHRVGRQLIYAADFARMNDLVGFLTENCCGGNPGLCAPSTGDKGLGQRCRQAQDAGAADVGSEAAAQRRVVPGR